MRILIAVVGVVVLLVGGGLTVVAWLQGDSSDAGERRRSKRQAHPPIGDPHRRPNCFTAELPTTGTHLFGRLTGC